MGTFTPNSSRRIGPDGTVEIVCRVCGNPIIRAQYRGFSTAICASCAGGEGIPVPEQQPEPNLYNEGESTGWFGKVGFVFRALGFGRKKPAITAASSKVAAAKKRKPLFSKPKPEESEEQSSE